METVLNFKRMGNFGDVNTDQFNAICNVFENLWQIEPLNPDAVARAIFPTEDFGHMSDHFAGKLVGFCQTDKTDANGFIRWFSAMTQNYQEHVCFWLNTRQF